MKKSVGYLLAYCAGVPVVAFAYGILSTLIISGAWGRKEGDTPPISPWLEQLGWVALSFPFGYMGVDSILVLPVVNGLFWGVILVSTGCALSARLRKGVYQSDEPNAG